MNDISPTAMLRRDEAPVLSLPASALDRISDAAGVDGWLAMLRTCRTWCAELLARPRKFRISLHTPVEGRRFSALALLLHIASHNPHVLVTLHSEDIWPYPQAGSWLSTLHSASSGVSLHLVHMELKHLRLPQSILPNSLAAACPHLISLKLTKCAIDPPPMSEVTPRKDQCRNRYRNQAARAGPVMLTALKALTLTTSDYGTSWSLHELAGLLYRLPSLGHLTLGPLRHQPSPEAIMLMPEHVTHLTLDLRLTETTDYAIHHPWTDAHLDALATNTQLQSLDIITAHNFEPPAISAISYQYLSSLQSLRLDGHTLDDLDLARLWTLPNLAALSVMAFGKLEVHHTCETLTSLTVTGSLTYNQLAHLPLSHLKSPLSLEGCKLVVEDEVERVLDYQGLNAAALSPANMPILYKASEAAAALEVCKGLSVRDLTITGIDLQEWAGPVLADDLALRALRPVLSMAQRVTGSLTFKDMHLGNKTVSALHFLTQGMRAANDSATPWSGEVHFDSCNFESGCLLVLRDVLLEGSSPGINTLRFSQCHGLGPQSVKLFCLGWAAALAEDGARSCQGAVDMMPTARPLRLVFGFPLFHQVATWDYKNIEKELKDAARACDHVKVSWVPDATALQSLQAEICRDIERDPADDSAHPSQPRDQGTTLDGVTQPAPAQEAFDFSDADMITSASGSEQGSDAEMDC